MKKEIFEKALAEEVDLLKEKTPQSEKLFLRAIEPMPRGVPTGVYGLAPYPIIMEKGHGAHVFDIDNNRYIDYANGFGVSVWGHANATITKAIAERNQDGIHFGTLSEEMIRWAEMLRARFSLDWLRISNSGTEATMDAIRLARAYTGRDRVAKISGAYHGTHDIALISSNYPKPEGDERVRLLGSGIPQSTIRDVAVLQFNDLHEAREVLRKGDVACIIIEPILFNVGAIFPEEGYLSGLRELCDETGTVLIFDETKTGMTVAYGGAETLFGVTPDIKTSGKGIGGGLACGLIGGSKTWGYDMIQEGKMSHLGTFPGNPLLAAAGIASLEVMDHEAYRLLEEHRLLLQEGIEEIISEFSLPAYSIGAGGKNCLVWSEKRLTNYDEYIKNFHSEEAFLLWFYMVNRGIWLAQGQDEQTTHSIDHGEREAAVFLENLRDFVKKYLS
jgi:glutamate-1-semialdehyde 2,1-aminomutase